MQHPMRADGSAGHAGSTPVGLRVCSSTITLDTGCSLQLLSPQEVRMTYMLKHSSTVINCSCSLSHAAAPIELMQLHSAGQQRCCGVLCDKPQSGRSKRSDSTRPSLPASSAISEASRPTESTVLAAGSALESIPSKMTTSIHRNCTLAYRLS